MVRYILLFAVIIFASTISSAQNVVIKEQAIITKMMDHFTQVNKSKSFVEGWRVQVLATTDRQKLESARTTFQLPLSKH